MNEKRLTKRLKDLEGNSLDQAVFYIEDVRGLLYLYNEEKEKNNKIEKYIRSNKWGEDYIRCSCRTSLIRILEGK